MRRWLLASVAALLFGEVGWVQAASLIYGSAYSGPNGPASLYTINPATGAATLVGPIGFDQVGALDFSPSSGVLYGTGLRPSDNAPVLLTINTTTGAGTLVSTLVGLSPFNQVQDISFRHADGTLFAYEGGVIFTLNTATGAATEVGFTGTFPGGNGLAFSSADTLYSANGANLNTVNQTTGALTLVTSLTYPNPPLDNDTRVNGMKFDNATGILYASIVKNGFNNGGQPPTNYFGTIDVRTGIVTVIGQTVTGLDAIAIQPTAIPEPSSAVLATIGAVVAVLAYGRSRHRRAQRRQAAA
jgi:hypothetical protein